MIASKPYVFIPHYQYEGDMTFGEWDGDKAVYWLGDGDGLTTQQCESYGAIFLTIDELCNALKAGLNELG